MEYSYDFFEIFDIQESSYQIPPSFHGPRDVEFDMSLCVPSHVTPNVNTALEYIAETEGFNFDRC